MPAGVVALNALLKQGLFQLFLDRLPRWIDVDLGQITLRHRHLRRAPAMWVELEHKHFTFAARVSAFRWANAQVCRAFENEL